MRLIVENVWSWKRGPITQGGEHLERYKRDRPLQGRYLLILYDTQNTWLSLKHRSFSSPAFRSLIYPTATTVKGWNPQVSKKDFEFWKHFSCNKLTKIVFSIVTGKSLKKFFYSLISLKTTRPDLPCFRTKILNGSFPFEEHHFKELSEVFVRRIRGASRTRVERSELLWLEIVLFRLIS